MFAAVQCIDFLCCHRRHTRILIAIDNTAVVGALRARYSYKAANEFITRIQKTLTTSDNVLEVVGVRSADNAADAPSREKELDASAVARCLAIIDAHDVGLDRCSGNVEMKSSPSVEGKLRHTDAEDDLLMTLPDLMAAFEEVEITNE